MLIYVTLYICRTHAAYCRLVLALPNGHNVITKAGKNGSG